VKRIIGFVIAVLVIATGATSANAVENGVSAEGDPRIVSLYKGSTNFGYISVQYPMCSAYLISDRIVVTAQHCTQDPQRDMPRDASELIVGRPGEKSNATQGRHYAVAAVYRAANYKKSDIKTDISFTNDVAVLVLAKAIPNVTKAKLLNEAEFNALILEDPQLWIGGYGLQKFADRSIPNGQRYVVPAKAPAKFANPADFKAAIAAKKANWNRIFYQESLVGIQMEAATGTICDGDSGAGFWTKTKTQTIYLGTLNGPIGISNCLGGAPDGVVTYTGIHPTYMYQSLFDQANGYVKKHPVKVTWTCKKGKLTKKVTAFSPKCPAGYKKA
jgi:secreted trypsin-like serine protease